MKEVLVWVRKKRVVEPVQPLMGKHGLDTREGVGRL
jgi:hypothetical protein